MKIKVIQSLLGSAVTAVFLSACSKNTTILDSEINKLCNIEAIEKIQNLHLPWSGFVNHTYNPTACTYTYEVSGEKKVLKWDLEL